MTPKKDCNNFQLSIAFSSKGTTGQTRNHTHASQVSDTHFVYAVVSKMWFKQDDCEHITVLEAEEGGENLDISELHKVLGDALANIFQDNIHNFDILTNIDISGARSDHSLKAWWVLVTV
jgi:hypothetical protein